MGARQTMTSPPFGPRVCADIVDGIVPGQEDRGGGDFFDGAEAADGEGVGEAGFFLGVAGAGDGDDFGGDGAGGDAVGVDPWRLTSRARTRVKVMMAALAAQ